MPRPIDRVFDGSEAYVALTVAHLLPMFTNTTLSPPKSLRIVTAEFCFTSLLWAVEFSMFQKFQEDRENILRARATGKAVLTSPFQLLGSHHLRIVLTFPVYKFKLAPNPSVE